MKTENYRLVISLEDCKIREFIREFKSDEELHDFAEDYLDGNNYIMDVYRMNGKKIHSFEYEVGSHNEMKMYDNI